MHANLTKLSNNLRIITESRPHTETVSLGIWINTGSAYETAENNGISHFVEHMVFKGTASRDAKQISEDIENVGGITNAYTSREFTVFYAKMLKNDIELAADVLCEFISAPTFKSEEMQKEKDVVIQEIKQTNDDPSDIVFDYFQETAFSGQPLGFCILGPVEKVRSFTADDLRNYMQTNYAAENIVISAVGNLQHEKFVDIIKQRLSDLRTKTSFKPERQTYTGGEFIKKRDVEQTQLLLGFPGVDYHDDKYYQTTILSTLLGGGMSSRLFQEIREKHGLVYSVYSFPNFHTQTGLFGIYAGLNQEDVAKCLPYIADEIKKITNEYVGERELNRVKVQLKANMMMSLESSSSTAEIYARQQLIHNRTIPSDEIIRKIDAVDKEDIMAMAQQIFSGKMTYTLLGNLQKYPDYAAVEKIFHI